MQMKKKSFRQNETKLKNNEFKIKPWGKLYEVSQEM